MLSRIKRTIGFDPQRKASPNDGRGPSASVHEFRTPTSVVGGYLRMLQRDSEASLSGQLKGLGTVGFLQKPFDLSALLSVTKAALES